MCIAVVAQKLFVREQAKFKFNNEILAIVLSGFVTGFVTGVVTGIVTRLVTGDASPDRFV